MKRLLLLAALLSFLQAILAGWNHEWNAGSYHLLKAIFVYMIAATHVDG